MCAREALAEHERREGEAFILEEFVNVTWRHAVASDVGFGDLSYFNRTFRRRYAATPSDIKQSSVMVDPPRR